MPSGFAGKGLPSAVLGDHLEGLEPATSQAVTQQTNQQLVVWNHVLHERQLIPHCAHESADESLHWVVATCPG